MDDSELVRLLREHAYLKGEFVLRSGRRSTTYLDKYRFETQPELLGPIGERLAQRVAEAAPAAVRLAGPELGAVSLAAATSLACGLPFLIVRKQAKEHGTSRLLEGVFEAGEEVCLIEDVVTTAGEAARAVAVLREQGLACRSCVCVVDREEGGADALARLGVRLYPLFRLQQIADA